MEALIIQKLLKGEERERMDSDGAQKIEEMTKSQTSQSKYNESKTTLFQEFYQTQTHLLLETLNWKERGQDI